MPLIADAIVEPTSTIYDGGHDVDEIYVVTLKGVSWYSQLKTAPGTNGLAGACLYKLRIFATSSHAVPPCGTDTIAADSYLDAKKWVALDGAQRLEHWTLKPGDRIKCGSTDATIIAVHDNRGSRRNPHWYVEAK